MSSLIHGRWKQYFQMPIAASVENLSPPAFRLYGFLCREMNVRSAVEQQYSNAEIASATRLRDHKTISKARCELRGAGLVDWHRVPPGVYAYVMLDQYGIPIPAPKDRKGVRRYVSNQARTPKRPALEPSPPEAAQAPRVTCSTESPPTEIRHCRTHGPCEHWLRGEDWVCDRCHPNPFRPPVSAGELGFD